MAVRASTCPSEENFEHYEKNLPPPSKRNRERTIAPVAVERGLPVLRLGSAIAAIALVIMLALISTGHLDFRLP